jgi:hypothetical protein
MMKCLGEIINDLIHSEFKDINNIVSICIDKSINEIRPIDKTSKIYDVYIRLIYKLKLLKVTIPPIINIELNENNYVRKDLVDSIKNNTLNKNDIVSLNIKDLIESIEITFNFK